MLFRSQVMTIGRARMASIVIVGRLRVSRVAGVACGTAPARVVHVFGAGRGVAVPAVLEILSITGIKRRPISVMVDLLSGRNSTTQGRNLSIGISVSFADALFQFANSGAVLFFHLGNLGTIPGDNAVELLHLGVSLGFPVLNCLLTSLDPGL